MRSFLHFAILCTAAFAACAPYSTRSDVVRDTPERILANLDQVPPALLQDALDTILHAPNPKGERYAMEAFRRRQFQDPVSQNKIIARLLQGETAESREFVLLQLKAKPELLNEAVLAWLLDKEPAGTAELLVTQLKNPVCQNARVAEYLVKKDIPGTPDALFAAARDKPSMLTPPVAQYFIDKRYAPFIPMIVSNIEKGENVDQNLKILSTMNSPEANTAVLDLARRDTPVRTQAMRVLPDIKEPEAREQAQVLLEQTWKTNEPGAVRSTALESYAQMRGVDPKDLERDRAFPMADVQADLSVNTLPEKQEPKVQNRVVPRETVQPARPAPQQTRPQPQQAVVTPRPDAKKTEPEKKTEPKNERKAEPVPQQPRTDSSGEKAPPLDERASAAYRNRIQNLMLDTFGESGGPYVMRRIQDSLATYGESRSTSADFMIRSYRKRFGGSEAVIRQLLARGLRQPDSLGAVIASIKEEYPGKEMQVYAIARLFALQRWQAQVILELSSEVQL